MFDMLTLDELYALHSALCRGHAATFDRMMDGFRPLIPVTGEEWAVLSASNSEIAETIYAVGDVINVREAERTALRYA